MKGGNRSRQLVTLKIPVLHPGVFCGSKGFICGFPPRKKLKNVKIVDLCLSDPVRRKQITPRIIIYLLHLFNYPQERNPFPCREDWVLRV
jgi:hypothetical protein